VCVRVCVCTYSRCCVCTDGCVHIVETVDICILLPNENDCGC
jgi:hypothetical protein